MSAKVNGSIGNNNTYNTYQFKVSVTIGGTNGTMQGLNLSYPCYTQTIQADLSGLTTSNGTTGSSMFINILTENQRMTGFLSFYLNDIRVITQEGSIMRCGVLDVFHVR